MKRLITIPLLALVLFGLTAGSLWAADPQPADSRQALTKILAGQHRSAENKARDVYRHPAETLLFFGLRDDMTVVEIFPGGGWYTEILAPFLREKGKYYAAGFEANSDVEFMRRAVESFNKKLALNPELYDKVIVTELAPPHALTIAPAATADLVLTFRNVHNWMSAGTADLVFQAMHKALKPGGILGVVEHRANPALPQDPKAGNGYVREDYVIALAEKAGFELIDKSEINANPKDTKNHPKGVWTLPPTLALGEQDKDKYLAIGESDRMTLKFRKRN